MNTRQRAFADLFLKFGNAAQAARAAGYSEKSARSTGARLLTNSDVRTYLAHRAEIGEAERVADVAETLAFLTAVMRGEVRDQFGLDASLSDRLAAARELLKRYSVTDDRQRGTLDRLDVLLMEFRRALDDDGDGGS